VNGRHRLAPLVEQDVGFAWSATDLDQIVTIDIEKLATVIARARCFNVRSWYVEKELPLLDHAV